MAAERVVDRVRRARRSDAPLGARSGMVAWASARTGLTIDVVPGTPKAWLLLALLIGGSLLAARPSLIALQVSVASISSANGVSTVWCRGIAADRSDR